MHLLYNQRSLLLTRGTVDSIELDTFQLKAKVYVLLDIKSICPTTMSGLICTMASIYVQRGGWCHLIY